MNKWIRIATALFGLVSIYGASRLWQKGKWFIVPALILSTVSVSSFYFSFTGDIPVAFASGGAGGIRQEINIIDGYLGSLSDNFATSSAIVQFDGTKYTAPSAYFEVVASTSASIATQVFLRNATSSATVATVNIPAGTTAYTRLRSSEITAMASTTQSLVVVVASTTGATKGVIAARVVILDSGSPLVGAETQIEIGNQESYTSSATSTFASPKYWYYNSAGWDGSPTFYAEVTYAATVQPIGATTTNVWSTAGTYNVVASSSYTQIAAWGGGGAGFDGDTGGGGSGGGGGAFASSTATLTVGNTYTIVVGSGGSSSGANGATSTFNSTTVVADSGGGGKSQISLAGRAGLASLSTGSVKNNGGSGGIGANGSGNNDQGGGGGGAGGPHGSGNPGTAASATLGGDGGAGDVIGGVVRGGATSTNVSGASGPAGNASTNGGGGGAGGDDGTSGGSGGSYGGGGGGGETVQGNGADGAVTLTSAFPVQATTTITLQEDNGQFGSWVDKVAIVSQGVQNIPTRVRSAAFTPTNGKHYRVVFSENYPGATHAIYSAKIVVDQTGGGNTSLSYATSNQDNFDQINTGGNQASGQSFVSTGGILATAKFYIKKTGTPTGTATAKLYNTTGTCSSSAAPTGAALATSDNFDVSTLTTSFALTTFTFSGANAITLTNGTCYGVAFEWAGGDGSNFVSVGTDLSAATDPGINLVKPLSGIWGNGTGDTIFSLDTTAIPPVTKLEPQYLLANTKLAAGTGLQSYNTSFATADWTTTNNYLHAVSAADNSTSVVVVQDTAGPTTITGSTVTSPDNYATSTGMCLSSNYTLDSKATTNNSDIYSSSIIVQVGVASTASCGVVGAAGQANKSVLIQGGASLQVQGSSVIIP